MPSDHTSDDQAHNGPAGMPKAPPTMVAQPTMAARVDTLDASSLLPSLVPTMATGGDRSDSSLSPRTTTAAVTTAAVPPSDEQCLLGPPLNPDGSPMTTAERLASFNIIVVVLAFIRATQIHDFARDFQLQDTTSPEDIGHDHDELNSKSKTTDARSHHLQAATKAAAIAASPRHQIASSAVKTSTSTTAIIATTPFRCMDAIFF